SPAARTVLYTLSLHDALPISYVFLMRMRFENAFTFTVNKISSSEHHKIIRLTLQLLIENAFKHNTATEESTLNITITIDNDYITDRKSTRPNSSHVKISYAVI